MKATFKMPQNKLSASFSMNNSLDPRKYATKAELQIETDNRISGDNQLGNRINLVEENILNLSATVNNNYTVLDNKFTSIYETINNYGDIVSYNATDFATANQGTLADTALQPNDNISELTNDAGYITSASLPTVNNATLTIQKNGTTVNTFTANASSNVTANITVPTDTADLTNSVGFITNSDLSGYATETWVTNQGYITGITSNDVTTALGYIPYNSTNPNGYITASALNGYATESWVTNKGYATQTWVGQQGYITNSVNNLTNYYTKTEIDNTIGDIETALHNINSGGN